MRVQKDEALERMKKGEVKVRLISTGGIGIIKQKKDHPETPWWHNDEHVSILLDPKTPAGFYRTVDTRWSNLEFADEVITPEDIEQRMKKGEVRVRHKKTENISVVVPDPNNKKIPWSSTDGTIIQLDNEDHSKTYPAKLENLEFAD